MGNLNLTVESLVDPYIPFPGLTILAGEAGAGKSYLMQALCRAVVTGEKWLGEFELGPKGNCLWMDFEMGSGLCRRYNRRSEPCSISQIRFLC